MEIGECLAISLTSSYHSLAQKAKPGSALAINRMAGVPQAGRHLKRGLEAGERMGHWIALTAVAPLVKWAGDIFGASEF